MTQRASQNLMNTVRWIETVCVGLSTAILISWYSDVKEVINMAKKHDIQIENVRDEMMVNRQDYLKHKEIESTVHETMDIRIRKLEINAHMMPN